MNNWFISNRDLIKNLCVNTGTSLSPTWTQICTASEIAIDTGLEEKGFYVFCDSLQRKIITGASVVLSGTIKLDVNNAGVIDLLGDVHSLIASGTISQFNNKQIKFDLLTSVSSNVLTYTT